MTKFSASYGNWTKASTAFVVFLFIGLAAVDFATNAESLGWSIGMLCFLPALLLFCYAFSVKYYAVTDDALIVRKPFGETKFKKADVESATLIDKKLLRFAIRTFGIGGLFGYYGEFYTGKLGSMTWYRTRMDNAVLVTIGKRKIVLSPDEPEKFIAALKP